MQKRQDLEDLQKHKLLIDEKYRDLEKILRDDDSQKVRKQRKNTDKIKNAIQN